MTRIRARRGQARTQGRSWALQDAKARFSEVVRKAKTEGPQHITVHGREEVIVLSAEEYRRVNDRRTGQALVELLQDSPLRDVEIEHEPTYAPVRGVDL
ncbi:MAG TPA: type II toxin-antitoxin system Phd/YefM family antitoxin [Thermoanaerobaculia bacterium]|nr:type II toxin-antitoxin system Phd/YefM family antitoxin [Thermoanaerobaculia bacterium]